jgi:hypothetical protein
MEMVHGTAAYALFSDEMKTNTIRPCTSRYEAAIICRLEESRTDLLKSYDPQYTD